MGEENQMGGERVNEQLLDVMHLWLKNSGVAQKKYDLTT
jgi:hypothetical protein